MTTTIKSLDDAHYRAWNAYVDAAPAGTFFHLAEWREVLSRVFHHRPHYLYAEAAGRITGVLPLAEVKSALFGHSLVSTPFCVYGGTVADDDETATVLERAAADYARQLKVDYLELRNRDRQCPDWPGKDLYVTFRKPIAADNEVNLNAIPRKQRAMVRKGIANGLLSEIDGDIGRFFPIYATSVRNLGTPVFARKYFDLLAAVFSERRSILTVTRGDTPIASVMSFYFRDEVLPYYAGGVPAARELKAYDFMYWELMRRSAEAGVRVFDYGRSKRESGSYSFKKNWGFAPEPLRYQYQLVRAKSIPNHSPANPKYRLFIAAWQKLPLGIANRIGPLISGALG